MAGLPHTAARAIVSVSNFFTWASSVIVVGITGYFIHKYTTDKNIKYWMIIATITLALWLPSFVLPWIGRDGYRPWYFPLNVVFSYLWLTAFIFAAQAYNRGHCRANSPFGARCSLKYANEAFMFIAFFFTMVALVADGLAARETRVASTHVEKDVRQSADTTGPTGQV